MNTVNVNILSDQGSHNLFLQDDPDYKGKRVIHALVDRVPYVVAECSASSAGTTLQGTAAVRELFIVFKDAFSLTVDPTVPEVSLSIAGGVANFAGIVTSADANNLVTFIKATNLPSLAA